MQKAIILIPETGNDLSVDTNGVNMYTIVNALHNLQRGLCQQLVKEARKVVGDNPKAQEAYFDKMLAAASKSEDRATGRDIMGNLN